MRFKFILILFLFFGNLSSSAQTIIPLFRDSIPNSIPNSMREDTVNWGGKFGGYRNTSKPTLEIYLPLKQQANGTAVIICPGGGYRFVSYQEEGLNIAKEFVQNGTAAFILKYRLPSDSIMKDKSIGPLQDAQQAIKVVRQRAAEWNVNVNKVGIMGFSAGGHLASTAGTHFDSSFIPNKEHINLRPDFMILVYPVISMSERLTHRNSRLNLLGANPKLKMVDFLSSELQVTDNTPPTWITHAGDDQTVDVENTIVFYQALKQHHVASEMHIYPKGDHGFVLNFAPKLWMQSIFDWMKTDALVK